MAVEYRPAQSDEMREFAYSGRIGFGETTAEESIERSLQSGRLKPEWTLCAFEDGVMASKMATFPFTMRWNGREIGCGGVTAVTTLPTHRRRGHLRELMRRQFEAQREIDQPVAMLWASMAAIYQRFGYGIAYTMYGCNYDPRHVRFVDEAPVSGRTRLVRVGDAAPVLAPIYDRFAAPRTLMLSRNEEWWTSAVLRTWRPEQAPPLVAVYEEAGEALGYVVYGIEGKEQERPGPHEQITVWDFAWLTPAAHRALTQYLLGYDLVYSIRAWRIPEDDPLFSQVQEPRLLNLSVHDGTLVRIVDLPRALEGRGYDADGRITFSFTDDLCPWNTGAWSLTVEGGQARVQRAEAEPQLCLSPRTLAILASGCRPATTLARNGLIPSADAAALATADALFRTTHAPFCADGF